MQQEKMTDSIAPSGDTSMKLASEQPPQEWVTPQFECIPLSEAMGPSSNFLTIDAAYSFS